MLVSPPSNAAQPHSCSCSCSCSSSCSSSSVLVFALVLALAPITILLLIIILLPTLARRAAPSLCPPLHPKSLLLVACCLFLIAYCLSLVAGCPLLVAHCPLHPPCLPATAAAVHSFLPATSTQLPQPVVVPLAATLPHCHTAISLHVALVNKTPSPHARFCRCSILIHNLPAAAAAAAARPHAYPTRSLPRNAVCSTLPTFWLPPCAATPTPPIHHNNPVPRPTWLPPCPDCESCQVRHSRAHGCAAMESRLFAFSRPSPPPTCTRPRQQWLYACNPWPRATMLIPRSGPCTDSAQWAETPSRPSYRGGYRPPTPAMSRWYGSPATRA